MRELEFYANNSINETISFHMTQVLVFKVIKMIKKNCASFWPCSRRGLSQVKISEMFSFFVALIAHLKFKQSNTCTTLQLQNSHQPHFKAKSTGTYIR